MILNDLEIQRERILASQYRQDYVLDSARDMFNIWKDRLHKQLEYDQAFIDYRFKVLLNEESDMALTCEDVWRDIKQFALDWLKLQDGLAALTIKDKS